MLLCFLLILGCTLAADPCKDYISYNGSTAHKGVSDSNSWDWSKDIACELHSDEGKMLNSTCGRCDAKFLDGDIWYRFGSPWTKLAEVPNTFKDSFNTNETFQDLYDDVCNAPKQFLLTSNGTGGFYNLIATRFGAGDEPCYLFDMITIERQDCEDFYVYKFPASISANAGTFCENADKTKSLKTGFCMEDTINTVSLTGDHHFAEPKTTITIRAERSPAPLTGVTCRREDDSSKVILTPLSGNNHTHHGYTFLLPNENVTCTIDDSTEQQISVYPVSFEEVRNTTGVGGVEIRVVCKVTLTTDTTGITPFIREGATDHVDIQDVIEGASTHRLELLLTEDDTKVPSGTRALIKRYSCGVKDTVDEITSQPFTLTLNKVCAPGTGFVGVKDTECVSCPVHTYSNNSLCINCPDGTDSQTEGATKCTKNPDPPGPNNVIIIVVVIGAVVLMVGIGVIVAIHVKNRKTSNEIGRRTGNSNNAVPPLSRLAD